MEFFISKKNKKKLEFFLEENNRIIQNALFFGEESLGKTISALYLAQSLLCLEDEKPCKRCESCLEFKKNCHSDFLMISPEEGVISIDKIRGLINFLSFKPQLSGIKIAIIDDAEKMTKEAQNALLKTLEESHLDNFLILVSSYPDQLLPTIRSRLMKIKFLPADKEEIKEYMIAVYKIKPEKADFIAEVSRGKIGEAIKMMDPGYLKRKEKAREILKKIIEGNEIDKLLIIDQEVNEEMTNFFLKEWLSILEKEKFLEEKKRISLLKKLFQAYLIFNSQNVNQKLLLHNIFLNI